MAKTEENACSAVEIQLDGSGEREPSIESRGSFVRVQGLPRFLLIFSSPAAVLLYLIPFVIIGCNFWCVGGCMWTRLPREV